MRKTIITALIALIAGMGSADPSGVKAGVNYCANNPQACMNGNAQGQLNGIIAAIQAELSSSYDQSFAD